MSIGVLCKVPVYEENNKRVDAVDQHLMVAAHWNEDKKVVISSPDGKQSWTVTARDLEAAIKNATNTNRFG